MKEKIDPPTEKVEKMSFPREELRPLLENLIEGGFSEEEAWRIVAHVKTSKREVKPDSNKPAIETDSKEWERTLRESGEFSEGELQKIHSHLKRKPFEVPVTIVPSKSEKIPVVIERKDKEKE